jgi:ribosomal protein S15P/S13E
MSRPLPVADRTAHKNELIAQAAQVIGRGKRRDVGARAFDLEGMAKRIPSSYSGLLRRPMFVTPQTTRDDMASALQERWDTLYQHFQIDPKDKRAERRLLRALIQKHVPGFSEKLRSPPIDKNRPGRRRKLDYMQRVGFRTGRFMAGRVMDPVGCGLPRPSPRPRRQRLPRHGPLPMFVPARIAIIAGRKSIADLHHGEHAARLHRSKGSRSCHHRVREVRRSAGAQV